MDKEDRPKISIYIAVSIDGYIAREDGNLDWLDRAHGFEGEDYGFQKLFGSIDALILGRKTYEAVAAMPISWPYAGKRVIVLSNTLHSVKKEAEIYRGKLTDLVSKLHQEGIKHIWVDGGTTASQFLSLQMVDAMTLTIIPVVLGSGIPLFHRLGKEILCRLISTAAYPNGSGCVQLNYEIPAPCTAAEETTKSLVSEKQGATP